MSLKYFKDFQSSSINTTVGIGLNSNASATSSIAIGNAATSSGVSSIAIGDSSNVTTTNSVTVGFGSSCINTADNSLTVGSTSTCQGTTSLAVGRTCQSIASNCGTIGTSVINQVANSLSFGMGSECFNICDPALGGYTYRTAKFTHTALNLASASNFIGGIIMIQEQIITCPTGTDFDAAAQITGNLYVGLTFKTLLVQTSNLQISFLCSVAGITSYSQSGGSSTFVASTGKNMDITFRRTGAATWDVYVMLI